MSIRVMNQVWESAPVSGNELLLLLALADNANDQGTAWPSVPTLARKTRTSERTVQRAITRLVRAGHLKVTGKTGTANRYQINTDRWTAPDPRQPVTPDEVSPPSPVTGVGVTQLCRGRGDTAVSPEPSMNHQKNRHVCDPRARKSAAPAGAGSGDTHAAAQRIIDDWVTACPAAKGQSRRAVLAVIAAALADGIEPDLIAAALVRVARDGFLVTERTLAVALAQHAAESARAAAGQAGSGIEPSRNALILAEARRRAEAAERAAAEGGQGWPGVAP